MVCGCDVPKIRERIDGNFVDIKCPRCGKVIAILIPIGGCRSDFPLCKEA